MSRPLRIEYPGAFYHVTSRGNEGRNIFNCDKDKERFLTYLEQSYIKFNTIIHTYCLMDNHYHLLIETPLANLSKHMQMVNSSYTTYFNLKYNRLGHLFQGRYKALLVDKDSYIQELSRYIHLNPVRAKVALTPDRYFWSSYKYYLYPRNKPVFLETKFILSYFANEEYRKREALKKFTEEGLSKQINNPCKEVVAGLILGSNSFVQKIKDEYINHSAKSRDLPSLRGLKKSRISSERIVNILKKEDSLTEQECLKFSAYLLRKYTGDTLEEIAEKLDCRMSAAATSLSCRRLAKKRQEDKEINKKLEDIEDKLLNVEV